METYFDKLYMTIMFMLMLVLISNNTNHAFDGNIPIIFQRLIIVTSILIGIRGLVFCVKGMINVFKR